MPRPSNRKTRGQGKTPDDQIIILMQDEAARVLGVPCTLQGLVNKLKYGGTHTNTGEVGKALRRLKKSGRVQYERAGDEVTLVFG